MTKLNDELIAEIQDEVLNGPCPGRDDCQDLLDTIADLQRQLAERDKVIVPIPGIIQRESTGQDVGPAGNAKAVSFPSQAALDAYVQEQVDRALAERPYALPDNSDPMFQREYVMVPKAMKCHACGVDKPWHTPRGKELRAAIEPQQVYSQADVDRAVLAESEWWANGEHDAYMPRTKSCAQCDRIAANRAKVKPSAPSPAHDENNQK